MTHQDSVECSLLQFLLHDDNQNSTLILFWSKMFSKSRKKNWKKELDRILLQVLKILHSVVLTSNSNFFPNLKNNLRNNIVVPQSLHRILIKFVRSL